MKKGSIGNEGKIPMTSDTIRFALEHKDLLQVPAEHYYEVRVSNPLNGQSALWVSSVSFNSIFSSLEN